MQLTVLKQEQPIVEFNYEEMKQMLAIKLEEYKDIVVTQDTLKDDKASQKELAGLRNKLDTFRKDIKKELEKPIKEAEAQIKELVYMVEEAEKPLKQGIEVFNERARNEKSKKCKEIADKLIEETQLSSKFVNQIEFKKEFLNVTKTFKAIEDDLRTQITALKEKEINEANIQAAIDKQIEMVNQSYNLATPLSSVQFDFEYTTEGLTQAIEKINSRGKYQAQAEETARLKAIEAAKPKEEPVRVEIPVVQPKVEPPKAVVKEKMYAYKFNISGPASSLVALREWLDQSDLTYEKLEGGLIDG